MSIRSRSSLLSLALLGACVDYGFHEKASIEPEGQDLLDTELPQWIPESARSIRARPRMRRTSGRTAAIARMATISPRMAHRASA